MNLQFGLTSIHYFPVFLLLSQLVINRPCSELMRWLTHLSSFLLFRADDLSLIFGTYIIEEQNWLMQLVLWPLHGTWPLTHIYLYRQTEGWGKGEGRELFLKIGLFCKNINYLSMYFLSCLLCFWGRILFVVWAGLECYSTSIIGLPALFIVSQFSGLATLSNCQYLVTI